MKGSLFLRSRRGHRRHRELMVTEPPSCRSRAVGWMVVYGFGIVVSLLQIDHFPRCDSSSGSSPAQKYTPFYRDKPPFHPGNRGPSRQYCQSDRILASRLLILSDEKRVSASNSWPFLFARSQNHSLPFDNVLVRTGRRGAESSDARVPRQHRQDVNSSSIGIQ